MNKAETDAPLFNVSIPPCIRTYLATLVLEMPDDIWVSGRVWLDTPWEGNLLKKMFEADHYEEVEARRTWLCADYALRVFLAEVVAVAVASPAFALSLRSLPPLVDRPSGEAARKLLIETLKTVYASGGFEERRILRMADAALNCAADWGCDSAKPDPVNAAKLTILTARAATDYLDVYRPEASLLIWEGALQLLAKLILA